MRKCFRCKKGHHGCERVVDTNSIRQTRHARLLREQYEAAPAGARSTSFFSFTAAYLMQASKQPWMMNFPILKRRQSHTNGTLVGVLR